MTDGAVARSKASWSYPVSVMMMKLNIAFTGALEGERISGAVTTAGRKGVFTAVRN